MEEEESGIENKITRSSIDSSSNTEKADTAPSAVPEQGWDSYIAQGFTRVSNYLLSFWTTPEPEKSVNSNFDDYARENRKLKNIAQLNKMQEKIKTLIEKVAEEDPLYPSLIDYQQRIEKAKKSAEKITPQNLEYLKTEFTKLEYRAYGLDELIYPQTPVYTQLSKQGFFGSTHTVAPPMLPAQINLTLS
jgi:hypothetical protein